LFYQHCENILESIAEAERLVTDFDATPKGRLRITAMANFGRRELARILNDFALAYPDISFELYISDRPVDIVQEGFDFALRIGTQEDSRLIAKPVAKQSIMICASPVYLEQWGTPSSFEDIINHRMLVISNAEYARANWLREFEKSHSFSINAVERKLTVNDIDLAYEACLQGMGVTALPSYIAERHVRSGELVHLFQNIEIPTRTINAVFPQNRYLSTKSRAFLDFVTSYFADSI
jgi:LysR family transcriptional regulator for bpeEF and oprC